MDATRGPTEAHRRQLVRDVRRAQQALEAAMLEDDSAGVAQAAADLERAAGACRRAWAWPPPEVAAHLHAMVADSVGRPDPRAAVRITGI